MNAFSTLWHDIGLIRWPLALSFVVILALAAWSAGRLYGSGAASDLRTKAWIDGILFWGGFSLISGVLGTLVGIVIAAQAIERAGEVQASLAWGGIKVAMLSSVLGTLILGFAALAWFFLQLRWRFLEARELEA